GYDIAGGGVPFPELQDYGVGVGSRHSAFDPLEDLHDRAVLGLARGNGAIRGKAFGAEKWNVFARELQQVGFLGGLGFVGDDNNGATGFSLHLIPPRPAKKETNRSAGD